MGHLRMGVVSAGEVGGEVNNYHEGTLDHCCACWANRSYMGGKCPLCGSTKIITYRGFYCTVCDKFHEREDMAAECHSDEEDE